MELEQAQGQYTTQLVLATPQGIALAAELLQKGEVVGLPTETVYGLAANAFDGQAVQKIFAAKGRPQDNPLIVHIGDYAMLARVVEEVPAKVEQLCKAFWPGPLTIVLPKGKEIAPEVSGGLDTVGVRMPAHPAALAIAQQAGCPFAAPSANRSGSPSPTTAAHVWRDMQGRIPLIVEGGACEVGVESTVLSMVDRPVILRPGFVTQQQLEAVLGEVVEIAPAVLQPLGQEEKALSPGMKYKHYAPKAKVTLVEGDLRRFVSFLNIQSKTGVFALCFEGEQESIPVPCIAYGQQNKPETQAAQVFAALRKLDDCGAQQVFVRMPALEGVGLAVYNRLLRAAAFRIVRE